MKTFVLILTMLNSNGNVVTAVPGFESMQLCQIAAKAWTAKAAQVQSWIKPYAVCAQVTGPLQVER